MTKPIPPDISTMILPGDFILVPVGGEGGRIVRALQGLDGVGFENYEHAALFVGHGTVIEMANTGIRLNKVDAYGGVMWSSGKINLTTAERMTIVENAQRYLARKIGYSWLDYAALVEHHYNIPNPGLQQFIASTKHMICSQLVDECYLEAGYHLFTDDRWPGYVTPGDLYIRLGGQ
jgi:hypothetical protein